nr:hypothetical protein [Bacteroidales bacterium]
MAGKIQTIREIRLLITDELKGSSGIREAGAIADLLIKHMFGAGTKYSIMTSALPVTDEHIDQALEYCSRIRSGMPVQYLTGETTFYNCTIRLSGKTLI